MSKAFYGGYLGNAGALNDLVYRGEPVEVQQLPYFGGSVNVDPLIAGSPSFEIRPRSPFKGMSQEELNKLKDWDQDPRGLQQYYERLNTPGPKLPFAYTPTPGAVPMGNAGFFAGPQMGQVPPGFHNKFVS